MENLNIIKVKIETGQKLQADEAFELTKLIIKIMELNEFLKQKGFSYLVEQKPMTPEHSGSDRTLEDLINEFTKLKEPKTFEDSVKPLMEWMGKNTHPHTVTIVRNDNAELFEGLKVFNSDEFIID